MADPNICERCGKCCCVKIFVDDEVVYLPLFCKFYDPQTKLCTVYENRFEANPHCLTVEEGVELGVFPEGCPYVRGLTDYHPPREQCTQEEFELYLADTPQEFSDGRWSCR